MNNILNNPSLRNRMLREGLLEAEACTPQENESFQAMQESGEKLPEGVFQTDESAYEFLRIVGDMPTPEKERNLLLALQTRDLESIRSWVTYLGVISILSIIVGVLSWLAN